MTRRLIKFAISGAGSTAIHIAVAWLLINSYGLDPAYANGGAFLVATVFSCLANTLWTFDSSLAVNNIARFCTVTGSMLLLSMSIAKAVDMAGLPPSVGILCVVLILPAITFLLHSNWTYR
jgi:putative flippase GtrA